MNDNWITTLVTILLLLVAMAWTAWNFYGKFWWAHHKWEDEQCKERARLRREAQREYEAEQDKAFAARAHAAGVTLRAAELKRIRTGENSIYDDARGKRFLDDRSGGKRDSVRLSEMQRANAILEEKLRRLQTNNSTDIGTYGGTDV